MLHAKDTNSGQGGHTGKLEFPVAHARVWGKRVFIIVICELVAPGCEVLNHLLWACEESGVDGYRLGKIRTSTVADEILVVVLVVVLHVSAGCS